MTHKNIIGFSIVSLFSSLKLLNFGPLQRQQRKCFIYLPGFSLQKWKFPLFILCFHLMTLTAECFHRHVNMVKCYASNSYVISVTRRPNTVCMMKAIERTMAVCLQYGCLRGMSVWKFCEYSAVYCLREGLLCSTKIEMFETNRKWKKRNVVSNMYANC